MIGKYSKLFSEYYSIWTKFRGAALKTNFNSKTVQQYIFLFNSINLGSSTVHFVKNQGGKGVLTVAIKLLLENATIVTNGMLQPFTFKAQKFLLKF